MKREISYIGGYDSELPEGALILEEDADYVKACLLLATPDADKTSLKIWIRKRYLFTWLQQYCLQIQLPCDFVEKTARLMLAEAWNVMLPNWLQDEDIISRKLLDLDVKNAHPCRFEDALLRHFLGQAFCGIRFAPENIPTMLPVLNREDAKALFDRYPMLDRCLHEQGEMWLLHAGQDWEKALIPLLVNREEGLWRDMSFYALLGAYPDKLLEYVLPLPKIILLRRIPITLLKELPLEGIAIEEAATHIDFFFKDIAPDINTGDVFRKVLQMTSGRLVLEFRLIKSILTAGRFTPAAEDIIAVREKFRQCVGLDSAELISLNYIVAPARPISPGKRFLDDPSAWVSWTMESYIPYRYWQTKSGCHDEEIESAVRLFTDWYLRDYAVIHKNADYSLVHALHSFRNSIQTETFSLIILVDGFPVTFWTILEDALRKAGFHRHALQYRFTPLPTDTEYVKPVLFSGVWNPPPKSYEALLRERAAIDWKGKTINYLSDLKKLADFSAPIDPSIVFLNLLAGDEVLHGNPEMKGETHEEELYRLFTRVSFMISALLERWHGQKELFGLYILTDHGACFIMDNEKQTFESKTVNKLFSDEKRRFAVIEKGSADMVPENIWTLGYRFTPPFIDGEKVFFIPRGHNTVYAGRAGRGYTHGGATPEEVIVPVGFFKAEKAAWKVPGVRFPNLRIDAATGRTIFHIQRITAIQIEMMNHNTEDIRLLRVTVLKPNTEIKGYTLPVLKKGKASTVQLDCYFNKTALGHEDLIIEWVYEIAGEEKTWEMKIAAEFRSAVTGGFSLKDL